MTQEEVKLMIAEMLQDIIRSDSGMDVKEFEDRFELRHEIADTCLVIDVKGMWHKVYGTPGKYNLRSFEADQAYLHWIVKTIDLWINNELPIMEIYTLLDK